jgi:penicillin-binding protein 1A
LALKTACSKFVTGELAGRKTDGSGRNYRRPIRLDIHPAGSFTMTEDSNYRGDPTPPSPRRRQNYFTERRDAVRRRLADRETRAVTAILLIACVILLMGLTFWIWALSGMPSSVEIDQSRVEQASIVYTADGEELTRYQDKNRTWIPLSEMSEHVIEALIATEDHRFYSHWGIDLRRTFGSAFRTLGGDRQGGSTITMQFARNAFPSLAEDHPLARKVKEWVVSLKIEGRYDKPDILEMYLNTVPFMYNAFGIEAAARTYFQKPASELEVDEAATLIGMLKGTVLYNPVRNPERSHERRNVVLSRMVREGFLSQDAYEELEEEETELSFRPLTRSDNLAPYFSEYLRLWLDEWAQDHEVNLYTDGLRIHTTIDSELQAAAEAAVSAIADNLQAVADVEWSQARPPHVSADASSYRSVRENITPFEYYWERHPAALDAYLRRTAMYRQLRRQGVGEDAALDSVKTDQAYVDSVRAVHQQLQAGLVAVDPNTGHVKAWVGGRDFRLSQYDNVAQAKRQPGSTFKAFVFAAALQNGYRSTHMVRDEEFEYVDPRTRQRWAPRNVGNITGDLMTLDEALAYSKNTITAQLTVDVGAEHVANVAHRMGIKSDLVPYPALGLGVSEVNLLELTSAYGTIAALGTHHEPLFVTHIEDQHGRVLGRFTNESSEAISPAHAYELAQMLKSAVDYGTGVRMRSVYGTSGDVGGKTGTSQNSADGWFVFIHPNLAVGSWVGFSAPSMTFRTSTWGQGSRSALPIVGEFYRNVRNSGNGTLATDARWQAPPGYSPPSQRDVLFATDRRFDFDSEFDRDPESTHTRQGSGSESGNIEPDEQVSRDVGETDIEDLDETDRLNRRERLGEEEAEGAPSAREQSERGNRGNNSNRRGGW